MTIALGCDHGGLELKSIIIEHLKSKGHNIKDFGTNDDNSCDYSDFAVPVCESVISKDSNFGVLICGTGIGMSMAANKIDGIRCALLSDVFSAKATRSHNDANVMALGARVIGTGLALELIDAFLKTEYSNEVRHTKRIDKISSLEKQ